ncbi:MULTISPECIES: hypothetical protein [unclassified Gemella]|uniref:hypothetical protein n=1 Tax=unclassified Gemella TaxID=2624949 RepID=UPI0015CFA289|nr:MULTISPECIES: hypothetical protein [unclassified Gemella]
MTLLGTSLDVANARYISSLNGIWVNSNSVTHTGYLEKTVWNGWYVVNLAGTFGNSILKSMLVNSNNSIYFLVKYISYSHLLFIYFL